jgi:hypothetical protein
MNKKSMPHIDIKDKGAADLYFEFLEPKERKEFFNDLTDKDRPTIELPDFGRIHQKGPNITNEVKKFNENDISKNTEKFIEYFSKDLRETSTPYLVYDDKKHKYKLKPKYDLEKMIREFTEKHHS